MGGKRAKPTQVDKWRKDIDFVEKITDTSGKPLYSNEHIALLIDYDPPYLSSCKTAKKNPGLALIEEFNKHFGHLIPPDEPPAWNPASKVRDPGDDDQTKKNASEMDNKYLQDQLDKTTDSLKIMADTNKEMAKANTLMVASTISLSERLVTIFEKINWKPS